MQHRLLCIFFAVILTACTPKQQPPISIAINPWPGYDLLYLAEQKGFFKQAGANIQLSQLSSLSDTQRAYLRGHVDGMASTLIETVQAQVLGNNPIKVVLITDYSNGGDVIIARQPIKSISDLKGKTVGCEVASLGIFMLQRALTKAGLNMSDINLVNVEQADGEKALSSGSIDAFISYPPQSITILNNDNYHKIFTSADIPNEIVDIISLSEQSLANNPGIVPKLHEAWQLAYDYYRSNPEDALAIMAKRDHITPAELAATFDNDLVVLQKQDQQALLKPDSIIQATIVNVCNTLVTSQSINTDCQQLPNLLYSLP